MNGSTNRKKLLLSFVLLLFTNCINLFAAETISPAGMAQIEKIMAFRVTLASMEPAKAIETAEKYIQRYEKYEKQNLSVEVQLVIENISLVDRINYTLLLNPKDTSMKAEMLERIKFIDDYMASHKDEYINEWALTSSADVFAMSLSFLSATEMIKRALMLKNFYLESIEKNENYSVAYSNLGQWYAEAPGIVGGSKEKAKNCFEKAYNTANTKTEKFYAAAMLSQSRFIDKDTTKAEELLDAAEKLQPGSFIVRIMKNANSVGEDYFYYLAHKAEVDKKIAKKAK